MSVDDYGKTGVVEGRVNIPLYEHEEFGSIVLPSIPHKDREYGGHLMINPPEIEVDGENVVFHHMSDIFDFDPRLFYGFQTLSVVAEKAMLSLPVLNGEKTNGMVGVINTLEAGNWQFHTGRYRSQQYPRGVEKDARCKSVHIHMYGRSPAEPISTPDEKMLHWGWGEAPPFPLFKDTPFAEAGSGKNWIVPDQFNDEEIEHLRNTLEDMAGRVRWP